MNGMKTSGREYTSQLLHTYRNRVRRIYDDLRNATRNVR
jgi:hypothetical protein